MILINVARSIRNYTRRREEWTSPHSTVAISSLSQRI